MARAAVRAKQLEKAKAQPAKARAHGRRRHSGGGNPNQELFFVRLRRHQKWVYALLAVVFGLSFVLVGVGSGSGGGLSQLWNGIFGGSGGTSISKASDEVKTNPAKGYRDLATAYESTPGDNAQAIIALQQYLGIKKNDAAAWAELGGLELTQGSQYATQYQNAQQASQLADPSTPFQPGGTLGTAIGPNAAYQQASQQASSRAAQAYQQATTALSSAVTDYQKASKLHPTQHHLPAGAPERGRERRQRDGRDRHPAQAPRGRSPVSARTSVEEGAQADHPQHAEVPVRKRPVRKRPVRSGQSGNG